MNSSTFFLTTRVIHVLCAALWLGTVVFLSGFLMPVLRRLGPDGGKVMVGIADRKFIPYIASISGLAVLTGLYLYWHLTGGFDPQLSGTMSARVFGAGGVLGIISAIIGGSIVGRSVTRSLALAAQAATMPDGAEKKALLGRIQALRERAGKYSQILVVLLTITMILMALGHYV
jgi:uncharacterized membrane protein